MPELKPCPFCGGKAKINQVSLYYFNVFCADIACIGFTVTGTYLEPQEAADAWNRRADAAKTQRGEWINGCECSVCGQAYGPHNRNQAKNYRYCTYCGAKMDGAT